MARELPGSRPVILYCGACAPQSDSGEIIYDIYDTNKERYTPWGVPRMAFLVTVPSRDQAPLWVAVLSGSGTRTAGGGDRWVTGSAPHSPVFGGETREGQACFRGINELAPFENKRSIAHSLG